MIIGEEDRKNVGARIGQLWKKEKACNICGEEKWTLSERLFNVSEFGAAQEGKKQAIPLVILTCGNCGNTIFFNAVMLGFKFEQKANS